MKSYKVLDAKHELKQYRFVKFLEVMKQAFNASGLYN